MISRLARFVRLLAFAALLPACSTAGPAVVYDALDAHRRQQRDAEALATYRRLQAEDAARREQERQENARRVHERMQASLERERPGHAARQRARAKMEEQGGCPAEVAASPCIDEFLLMLFHAWAHNDGTDQEDLVGSLIGSEDRLPLSRTSVASYVPSSSANLVSASCEASIRAEPALLRCGILTLVTELDAMSDGRPSRVPDLLQRHAKERVAAVRAASPPGARALSIACHALDTIREHEALMAEDKEIERISGVGDYAKRRWLGEQIHEARGEMKWAAEHYRKDTGKPFRPALCNDR